MVNCKTVRKLSINPAGNGIYASSGHEPKQSGTVRRVLNGASNFQGVSLNKVLLTGPDHLQNLIQTLIRFSQHQLAVSADIEGMFLQVGVLPFDQPARPFLWQEDPSKSVEVYQYTRHILGQKDSKTCANYALQTARDHEKEYPNAAKAIHDKLYMDDYVDSMESPDEALKRSRNLVKLLSKGGFKLTKFISNVPSLLEVLEDQSVEAVPKVVGFEFISQGLRSHRLSCSFHRHTSPERLHGQIWDEISPMR